MEIQKSILESLAEGRDSLGFCLDGNKERGFVYRLHSPVARKGYIAVLARSDGQTFEVVGIWDRKGRPTWVTPRVVGSEGLFHLLERADDSVRSGSWRGRGGGENG